MNAKDLVSREKGLALECNFLSQANETSKKSKFKGPGIEKILNEESSLKRERKIGIPRVTVNSERKTSFVSGATGTRSTAITHLSVEKGDYGQLNSTECEGRSWAQFPSCKERFSAKPVIAKMAEPELIFRSTKTVPKTIGKETNDFISQGSISANMETWRAKNAGSSTTERTRWIVRSQTQAELAVCECLLKEHDYFKDKFDKYEKDKQIYEKQMREKIAKHWNENVFRPVNRLLNRERKGGALDKELNKKRELFQKYLEYVNRKDRRGVFLNTVNRAEYDPGNMSVRVNGGETV